MMKKLEKSATHSHTQAIQISTKLPKSSSSELDATDVSHSHNDANSC